MVLTVPRTSFFSICLGQARGRGMAYVVRAMSAGAATGTFAAEEDTRREAVELAKSLREDGFWVIIIGPDGKPLDETKEDA